MTQQQINELKVGDWLKIKDPKSPAAAQQRECITKIEVIGNVRVADIVYYNGVRVTGDNRCELNLNLFGDMELVWPRENTDAK